MKSVPFIPDRFRISKRFPQFIIIQYCILVVALNVSHGQDTRKPNIPAGMLGTEKIEVPPAFEKSEPESLADLKAMQAHWLKLVPQLRAATVCLQTSVGQGSGVIVSPDGYVMTAAHVIDEAGQSIQLILPDGTRVRGESLGMDKVADIGLVKLNKSKMPNGKDWPHTPVTFESPDANAWVIALGHPRGYHRDRKPVLRTGRLLTSNEKVLRSDCLIVGGDSGGPLFDIHGRVIGIHSRLGPNTKFNFHVPVSRYEESWARMANSEVWGDFPQIIPASDDNFFERFWKKD